MEQYKSDDVAKGDEERVDAFFHTLSRMFDMEPETRVGALEACQALRDSCVPGYFFSFGRRNRTLPMIEPIPLTDIQRDDNSVFRFRQLNITTRSGPLLMLEGCYLVNVRQLIEVISQGLSDIETATYSLLKTKQFERACWRFKKTNELPERYVRIEDALSLCKNNDRLKPLALALWERKKKLDATTKSPAPEATADDDSDSDWDGIYKIGLMESIPNSSHIIAITQEGCMILVRAKDGHVHLPSLQALQKNQLLAKEDVAVERYVSVREATIFKDALSHNDILSLGAATYTSYPSY